MLQWYFLHTYVANDGGKLPLGVSQVPCHLETKFERLYPCRRGKLFNGLKAKLYW